MNETLEIVTELKDQKNIQVIKLKPYNEPQIYKLGTMQKYTLGGSIGTGDSAPGGDFFSEQEFGGSV